MTATPRQRRRAADPRARGAELRALAEDPELWPILAANPATYPDLLDYLREHGDEAVLAALDARATGPVPPAPRRRPGLVAAIVVIGVLVLLGAAGAISIPVLRSTTFSPEATARAFADDVARGDFAAATALADLPAEAEQDRTLLAADGVRLEVAMTDIAIGAAVAVPGSDRVEVPIDYRVGDEALTGTIVLAPAERVWLVLDRWRIVDTTLVTEIDVDGAGAATATIGGVGVPLRPDGPTAVAAYPGAYAVSAEADSAWFSFAAEPSTVIASEPFAAVALTRAPTPELAAEIDRQAQALVTDCLARNFGGCRYLAGLQADPADRCTSAKTPDPDYVSGPTSAVSAFPVLTADWSDGDRAVLHSAPAGTATLSWDEREIYPYGEWGHCQASAAVDFYGTVTVDGETVTVE